MDYGPLSPGVATHHLSLYRHSSGALVFGAGTTQWSWGLDATHDLAGTPTDTRMKQATVNLFADMGVQPATLQSGLVAATQSTDFTPPTSVILTPPGRRVVSTWTGYHLWHCHRCRRRQVAGVKFRLTAAQRGMPRREQPIGRRRGARLIPGQ